MTQPCPGLPACCGTKERIQPCLTRAHISAETPGEMMITPPSISARRAPPRAPPPGRRLLSSSGGSSAVRPRLGTGPGWAGECIDYSTQEVVFMLDVAGVSGELERFDRRRKPSANRRTRTLVRQSNRQPTAYRNGAATETLQTFCSQRFDRRRLSGDSLYSAALACELGLRAHDCTTTGADPTARSICVPSPPSPLFVLLLSREPAVMVGRSPLRFNFPAACGPCVLRVCVGMVPWTCCTHQPPLVQIHTPVRSSHV